MQNILGALANANMLTPISASNTGEATSGWIDVRHYQGLIRVILHVGLLTGTSLTWTFEDANTSGGGANLAIVPVGGALTVITTSNDNPNLQVAVFDARAPRGWLKCIGTLVGTSALVSAQVEGIVKY